ncbi:hypothetical protein GE061_016979 [Apolygus lucorum]|uniref:F-box domain-containing protein n=1 Tax=Apolygus lucorum TaxID=248454 RepID=A0A8S9XJS0_APOLU|nr:hypothetical protein GE061_016979 [Apolygus lucorum]
MSAGNQLLGLPQEVFEEVLLYLNLEDIFSCEKVCVGWKNAINSNKLWRHLYEKNVPSGFHKVFSDGKKLQSEGQIGGEHRGLKMLCSWRRKFVDFDTLKENWRSGQFVDEDITLGKELSSLYYRNTIITDYDLFSALSSGRSMRHEFFKMKDNSLHADDSFGKTCYDSIKLVNNVLVVVKGYFMQVYSKDNVYIKKFEAFFDENQPCETEDALQKLKRRFKCDLDDCVPRCNHNGEFFVGSWLRPKHRNNSFHIWNLESSTKIKTVNILKGELLINIRISMENHNVVGLIFSRAKHTTLRSYDLKTMSYTNFDISKEGEWGEKMVFTKTYLTIVLSKTQKAVLLYDVDGACVAALETPQLYHPCYCRELPLGNSGRRTTMGHFKVSGDILVMTERWRPEKINQGSVSRQIRAFDLSKMSDLDIFSVPSSRNHYMKVHVHLNDLMLVRTMDSMLIRDMKARNFTYKLPYGDFIPPDPSSTKMIVWNVYEKFVWGKTNKIKILYFW